MTVLMLALDVFHSVVTDIVTALRDDLDDGVVEVCHTMTYLLN